MIALKSLQARLLVTVLGLLLLVWLIAAAATWSDTRHELNELLDAHLAQTAALAASQADDEMEADDFVALPRLHKYQTRVALQVWHERQMVAQSAKAPKQALAPVGVAGFADTAVGQQRWRVFAAQGKEADLWVQVGELQSARDAIVWASLRSAIWPMLLALPILALGIWAAVRALLTPLRELGRNVAARDSAALHPLPVTGVAPEVLPLVKALNELFGRMAQLLESERRFTADAAHELRTPIAAIRMQAQVALGAGADAASRDQALVATVQGCDRAARLVDQLLMLARLEAHFDPAADTARTDMAALTRTLLAQLGAQALAQHQTLDLEAPQQLLVDLPEALAAILLRNLVDNALRYSPPGATIKVSLMPGPPVQLVVQDSGPGMSPDAMQQLGQRFFRVLGTQQSGSGLGWSIVKRVARLYGLRVEPSRSQELGGLCVRVFWPVEKRVQQ